MDASLSLPGSPVGGPLQAITPDRVNQRRESIFNTPLRPESRDSSVHEKISQFNNLSASIQSRHLERKTADAALKRAMLGREEAESEMRKAREEIRALRSALEEGKDRERKVGERLETVMESYGRAKETHAHTQALWEKEIRRARKENFKTQSSTVKLQEELKSTRTTTKMLEENLEREKERSRVREQEAFTARYQIVGVQEQLDQALERIKVVEQERDAFKTAAKNEEVARIAAEGRLPLPASEAPGDEFASPVKKKTKATLLRKAGTKNSRVSLSTMDLVSSAASEQEIEELSMQVMWERQRAERAQEMIEFMQAEQQMQCCPCSKSDNRANHANHTKEPQQPHSPTVEMPDAVDMPDAEEPLLDEEEDDDDEVREEVRAQTPASPAPVPTLEIQEAPVESQPESPRVVSKKGPRRSTIFCPKEGTFRTVSELEAAEMEAENEVEVVTEVEEPELEDTESMETERNTRMFARTPSVEPPAFALLAQQRTSLQSLLNAPHDEVVAAPPASVLSIPTVSDEEPTPITAPAVADDECAIKSESPETRRSASANAYTVTTTVPIKDDKFRGSASFSEKLRTPSSGSNCSFDLNNPALTPTMTREEALAKIRERRGRARSVAQGTIASQKKVKQALERRDMSAPTAKKARRS